MQRQLANDLLKKLSQWYQSADGRTTVQGEEAAGHTLPSRTSAMDWQKDLEAKVRGGHAAQRVHQTVLETLIQDAQARREQIVSVHNRVRVLETNPEASREVRAVLAQSRTLLAKLQEQSDAQDDAQRLRDSSGYKVKVWLAAFAVAGAASGALCVMVIWWFFGA